jgi:hypothetical protein
MIRDYFYDQMIKRLAIKVDRQVSSAIIGGKPLNDRIAGPRYNAVSSSPCRPTKTVTYPGMIINISSICST